MFRVSEFEIEILDLNTLLAGDAVVQAKFTLKPCVYVKKTSS